MGTLSATEVRKNIYKLIDEVSDSHRPLIITGRRSNAVLISEEDWNSIQETLYLLSIPGLRDEITKGLKTSVEECSEVLDW